MERNREIEGTSTLPAWVKSERKPRPEQALGVTSHVIMHLFVAGRFSGQGRSCRH